MKSLVILAISLFSANLFAASPMNPCSNEQALNVAKRAQELLVKKYKVTDIEGVTSIGISSCNPLQFAKMAGHRVPAVMRKPVCGVTIGFVDQFSAREIARQIISTIGSKVQVSGGETSICGQVTGLIVPQGR